MGRKYQIVLASLLVIGILAFAGDQENKAEQEEIQTLEEEMTVTPRKREEKLMETPETVTSFSAQQVEEAGIEDMNRAIDMIPNISIYDAQTPGNVAITVRGISQVRNGEPPMAIVIDGVNLINPYAITQDLYDVERIEVTKGPQGALYGRNAIGGAVTVITKAPTYERKHYLKMGVGNAEQFKIGFASSGGLRENLFYRVSGTFMDRDGYIDNVNLNKSVDDQTDKSITGRLLYLPNDKLELDFKFSTHDTEDGGNYYIAMDFFNDPASNRLGSGNRDLTNYSLKFEYRTEAGTLMGVTAFNEVDDIFTGDLDFTPTSFLDVVQDLSADGTSQELRFTSPDHQRFRWLAGVYVLDLNRRLDTIVQIDLNDDGEFDTGFSHFEDNDNLSTAGYLQVNYDLTPALELTAALRYDREKREQVDPTTDNYREKTFDKWQPKTTLSYKWNGGQLLYASFAEGFRSGGFNAPGVALWPAVFENETSKNFEVGFKAITANKRVFLNAALFHTDIDNSLYHVVDIPTGSQGNLNIEKSEARGIDLQIRGILSNHWQILAAYGSTDSEILAFDETNNPFLDRVPGPYVGNNLPNTPVYEANFALHYDTPINDRLSFLARAEYERRGRVYWHVDNGDTQEPLDLVNFRTGISGDSWSLSAWVHNLTDETYLNEFFAKEYIGTASDIGFPAFPRTYGLEFKKQF